MPAKKETARSPLEQLANEFERFLVGFADKITATLKSNGQHDDAEIAAGLRQGLAVQAKSLSSGIAERIAGANEQQRRMLQSRTRESGGLELVRAAQAKLAASDVAPMGLVDIIEAIKKIILQILDLLGIKLTDWIRKLIDLINNIIRVLAGLFGWDIGKRAERAQNLMYRHLREIYKTEAASLAREDRRAVIEEAEEA